MSDLMKPSSVFDGVMIDADSDEYGNRVDCDTDKWSVTRDLLEFNMWMSVMGIAEREGRGVWTTIPRVYKAGTGPCRKVWAGTPYWFGVYKPYRKVEARLAEFEEAARLAS